MGESARLVGSVLAGRYRVEKVLGRGGMGAVYLAREPTRGGRPVAIKEMALTMPDPVERAKTVEQFEREAAILGQLDHPALVDVLESFRDGDRHYIVMDYIDGQTLAARLEWGERPSLEEVRRWAGQLCEVLHYMHNHEPKILFRDLKPSNVMVDSSGSVRLIDFGIARVFEQDIKTHTIIKGVGSTGFAPIEQYGAGETDVRTDVYALGATLYNLLTGEKPPAAISILAGTEHLQLPSGLNPNIPRQLERVLLKMMALQKENRFASMEEVRQALEAAFEGDDFDCTDALTGRFLLPEGGRAPISEVPASTAATAAPGPVDSPRPRRPLRWAAAALVLVLAGFFGFQAAGRGRLVPVSAGPEELRRALSEGGKIRLEAGTYRLNQTLVVESRADVDLVGAGADRTIIEGSDRWAVVRCTGRGVLRLSGISFRRVGGWGQVVSVEDGRAVVRRCSFSGGIRSQDGTQGGTGLRIGERAAEAEVEDCEAHSNQKHGFQASERSWASFRRNRSWSNGWGGIGFIGEARGEARDNECFENTNGISVYDRSNAILENNLCRDNEHHGIRFLDKSLGQVRGNRCLDNGGYGIQVHEGSRPVIDANEFQGNRLGDRVEQVADSR